MLTPERWTLDAISSGDTDRLRVDNSYGDGFFVLLTTDALTGAYRRRAERL